MIPEFSCARPFDSRIIYLHGFASSPASRKAQVFIEKLAQQGIPVEALDLAPDFRNLTISGQLSVVETAVHGRAVTLIGSSMGGYLAAILAARHQNVVRLILMAPAFDFYRLWNLEIGQVKMDEWRKTGSISVFHYAMGSQVPLSYKLMEDALQYPPFPDFEQPCLLLHGLGDAVVPFESSAQFAANHPNVTLIAFDAGHEMTEVLNDVWTASSTFLLGENTKVV